MARISDDELERLKREVSIERLVEARGVKLRRHGKDWIGLCPFHDDKRPSLVVTPDMNLWHCLGACNAGGSVIDWVMKAEGVSFRHAVELLRADAPSLAADPRRSRGRQKGPVPKVTTTRKLAGDWSPGAGDAELFERVVAHYQAELSQSSEALAYLEKRGLKDEAMIARFQLGFSNRTLGYRIPMSNRKDGAELRGRLEALGILRESGHEHLNGSIVVPLLSADGSVVQLYGRKIGERLREGTALHLYLPGPHRGLLNREAFSESKEIILCEAIFDALSFWCAGFRHVTSCYGAGGMTDELREVFEAHRPERVLVAFDRDKAGDRGAERVAAELGPLGIEVMRVLFPHGVDANELATNSGRPARESLDAALRGAVWMAGKRAAVAVPEAPAEERATEKKGAAEALAPALTLPLAAPSEPAPHPSLATEERAELDAQGEVRLGYGERQWRVRGLSKNARGTELRVNLLVSREGVGFHVDSIELYSARQRALFTKMASEELAVDERLIKKDLGAVLLELERLLDEAATSSAPKDETPAMSEQERARALELLRDPKLVERLAADFERLGVVGERTNKLMLYLSAVSRMLDEPLAVVIQSSSAAGKSSLMEAVLSLVPDEARVQYSAMTGQSLFYMGESDLRHKILAIVEEEGAERASYALKLLQSEGELTIASTSKDPQSGRLVTQEYRVEGPVMIMLTTTAIDVDEELLNRCLVLTVDEGREQTRAIHARQRRSQTLAGLLERRDKSAIVKLHQNAQRLLRPLHVVNPFAEELRFVDHQPRTRRDHMKYLTLIRTIALVHQHQREVKEIEHRGELVRYIEVSASDIELANRLCHQVLGRSLDELAPQTRRLLERLDRMVSERCGELGLVKRGDYLFSRREVREHTGWSQTQLRVHLGRLVEMEYLLVHRGTRGQGFVYELCWDGRGKDGSPFLPSLLETAEASAAVEYDEKVAGSEGQMAAREAEVAGRWRPDVGPKAGGWRGADGHEDSGETRPKRDRGASVTEIAPRAGAARKRNVVDARRAASAKA